ncbi:MAG: biotin synthase BioB [Desulfobacteraceae bacterium]|nr:biotin synthase BioB [Desulfobacteraceae bacterium]
MFEISPDHLAEKIINKEKFGEEDLLGILKIKGRSLAKLLYITDKVRYYFFGDRIGLCKIMNAKSGNCSEDCIFCTQSFASKAEIDKYNFKTSQDIIDASSNISKLPVKRFGIVTSGRGPLKEDLDEFKTAVSAWHGKRPFLCASFGIADYETLKALKEKGLQRYHHNLETSKSMFQKICTTHNFRERIETVRNAKRAGLKVCSGGIFGLGETDEQILEFAMNLKEADPDSIPVNFLVPVKGTKAYGFDFLTPLRCLLIVALLRIVMPDKEIIICGGRKENLKELYPFVFHAGASNLMTGNYLTTSGEDLENDLRVIRELGFYPDMD